MANAKAQINPIQLQGAELNLNKFDAEIKPYSGFNKNNSPFVGGCLSNLFIKTETNTTGSSDSVYVDDNGDVYSIQGEDLNWRLEKKDHITGEITIINRWNNAKIINVEEVKGLPANTVYYYKAPDNKGEVWITLDIINAEIHYKKGDYETYISLTLKHGTYSTNEILFNVECCKDNIYVSYNFNYSYYYSQSVGYVTRNDNSLFYLDTTDNEAAFTRITEYTGYEDLLNANTAIMYDAVFDRVYYVLNRFDKCYILDNASTPVVLSETTTSSLIDSSQVSWTDTYQSVKYCFTKKIGEESYLAYVFDITFVQDRLVGYLKPVCDTSVGDPEEENVYKIILTNTDNKNGYVGGAIKGKSYKLGTYNNNYCFQNYGAFYGLTLVNNDSIKCCGVSGTQVTHNITLRKDDNFDYHAMVEMGCVVGSCVLFNNGVATGVCSPSGVLLAEWNSVDKNFLFPQGNSFLSWKDINTNKIYSFRLEENSNNLWLKNINGQLVTNLDVINNSYDLQSKKKKSFAYAWNNRALFSGFVETRTLTLDAENIYYAASSVNEYDLKANASLILNPVAIAIGYYIDAVNFDYIGIRLLDNFFVNYYLGENEIVYQFSETFFRNTRDERNNFFKNEKLLGLPFPSNADGNVQYSPSLFATAALFGNDVFIKEGDNAYQLMKDGFESVMSYYLGTLIENFSEIFILQGQYYVIINQQIFNVQFSGGVVQSLSFVVSVENLQFVGNSVYQAYFFSKTNRCLYTFSGANMLSQVQLVDKISEVHFYKYNQATQSIILVTDIGTLISSNLGMYLLEDVIPDNVYFYKEGAVLVDLYKLTYVQYYPEEGFEKHNIELETCFYGLNNQTVTISDCLYFRLFSEEHEEGEIKVSATTLSLQGRKTEDTTFKIKASDWDSLTDSLYIRYQPKEQRGLGISFSIDSPFKIASISVGTQADAVLIDKVSKGAINAPQQTSNNVEW